MYLANVLKCLWIPCSPMELAHHQTLLCFHLGPGPLLQSGILEKYKSINCCSSQMDERGHKNCILSSLISQSSVNPLSLAKKVKGEVLKRLMLPRVLHLGHCPEGRPPGGSRRGRPDRVGPPWHSQEASTPSRIWNNLVFTAPWWSHLTWCSWRTSAPPSGCTWPGHTFPPPPRPRPLRAPRPHPPCHSDSGPDLEMEWLENLGILCS